MSEEALEWSFREELDEKLIASLAEMKDLHWKKQWTSITTAE